MFAELLDFVVLSGEPGQGLLPETGQLGDQGVLFGQAPAEGVVTVFEAGDLVVARVRAAAGVAERGQAAVEFVGEVLVWTRSAVSGVEAAAVPGTSPGTGRPW